MRRDGLTKGLPNDAVARVFALGFVLDQFRRNLEDLVSRTMEVQRSKQEAPPASRARERLIMGRALPGTQLQL